MDAVRTLPVGALLAAEHIRGSFLSTKYPGSSEGFRLNDACALVLAADQPMQKIHYFVVVSRPGNVLLFGWIQDLTRWPRLDVTDLPAAE